MTKGKRLLRFGAGILGVLLILSILAGSDFFFGGPISKEYVKGKMQGYLDRAYHYRQLRLGEVSCTPEFREYYAKAFTPADEDVYFTIYYKDGSFWDTYEEDLETGRVLLSRQEKICRDSVKLLFEAMSEIDSWGIQAIEPRGNPPILAPPYREGMIPTFEVYIHSIAENPTPEYAAQILQKVCGLMEKSNFEFELYRIRLDAEDGEGEPIDAYGFTPEIIQSSSFVDSFEDFRTQVEFPKGSGDAVVVYTPEAL